MDRPPIRRDDLMREYLQQVIDQHRAAEGARELAVERLSTAEALQHLTGQRDRRPTG